MEGIRDESQLGGLAMGFMPKDYRTQITLNILLTGIYVD